MRQNSPTFSIFRVCRNHFAHAAGFSLAINVLYLASPIYMTQVYDRVISSGSLLTLGMLTLALLLSLAVLSVLDAVRTRLFVYASIRLDNELSYRLMSRLLEHLAPAAVQTMRQCEHLRQFVKGPGLIALFDLPFTPIFVGAIFLLHPILGSFAAACVAVLITFALFSRKFLRPNLIKAGAAGARNQSLTENSLSHRDLVRAMGMTNNILARWQSDRSAMQEAEASSGDLSSGLQGISKFLSMSMQSLILGLSAWLVIEHQLSAAAILPANVMLGRALQPIGQLVSSWNQIHTARAAWSDIEVAMTETPRRSTGVAMPVPTGAISIEGLIYGATGSRMPILRNVNLFIPAGETTVIGGPSGSGKTTLARQILGLLPASSGAICLDGVSLNMWLPEHLGQYIGYLPQNIRLLPGSIADNIGRLGRENDDYVVAAAKHAGIHEAILKLPNAYETPHDEADLILPASLKQLICLARAIYRTPKIILLDDPNAHLDLDGEKALATCVREMKALGSTVIILSQRTSFFELADRLVVLQNGAIKAAGPRNDVMVKLSQSRPASHAASLAIAS